jgi:Outer membrane protein beta-barrel domain
MGMSTHRAGFLYVVMGLCLPGFAQAQQALDEMFAGVDTMGAGPFYYEVASGLGPSVAPSNESGHISQGSGGLFGNTEENLHIGGRFGIMAANGEPANDMMMYGVFGRYRFKPRWHWGLGVDFLSFDFERPYSILKIQSTVENDADASNTIISTWLEYEYTLGTPNWIPFFLGGIGVGITDVDDVRGDIPGGGTYDIAADGGTEVIPMVGLGLRHRLGDRLAAEFGARAQYHIGGWDVKDRISGLTGSVDDYFAYGAYAGVVFRF